MQRVKHIFIRVWKTRLTLLSTVYVGISLLSPFMTNVVKLAELSRLESLPLESLLS